MVNATITAGLEYTLVAFAWRTFHCLHPHRMLEAAQELWGYR